VGTESEEDFAAKLNHNAHIHPNFHKREGIFSTDRNSLTFGRTAVSGTELTKIKSSTRVLNIHTTDELIAGVQAKQKLEDEEALRKQEQHEYDRAKNKWRDLTFSKNETYCFEDIAFKKAPNYIRANRNNISKLCTQKD